MCEGLPVFVGWFGFRLFSLDGMELTCAGDCCGTEGLAVLRVGGGRVALESLGPGEGLLSSWPFTPGGTVDVVSAIGDSLSSGVMLVGAGFG